MNDSLMIFEDAERDGVADKRTIFARVHNPLGFEFWGGGVLVTSGPDLLFLKDTDGDDKADVRLSDVCKDLGRPTRTTPQTTWSTGRTAGFIGKAESSWCITTSTPWKQNLNVGGSGMYRFDPRTFAITPHAENRPQSTRHQL